jgi:hypothetical protein
VAQSSIPRSTDLATVGSRPRCRRARSTVSRARSHSRRRSGCSGRGPTASTGSVIPYCTRWRATWRTARSQASRCALSSGRSPKESRAHAPGAATSRSASSLRTSVCSAARSAAQRSDEDAAGMPLRIGGKGCAGGVELAGMCAACAMAAAAGATGARAWLQAQHLTWLTPKRMRAATVTVFIVAGTVSSVGIGGSSTPPPKPVAHHASAQAR